MECARKAKRQGDQEELGEMQAADDEVTEDCEVMLGYQRTATLVLTRKT